MSCLQRITQHVEHSKSTKERGAGHILSPEQQSYNYENKTNPHGIIIAKLMIHV